MTEERIRYQSIFDSTLRGALASGGYRVITQPRVGPHNRELEQGSVLAAQSKSGIKFLVAGKWQQDHHSIEEEVPFEVLRLIHSIRMSDGMVSHAYLVLAGVGWTLMDFYLSGNLEYYVTDAHLVRIVSLDSFVGKILRKAL